MVDLQHNYTKLDLVKVITRFDFDSAQLGKAIMNSEDTIAH